MHSSHIYVCCISTSILRIATAVLLYKEVQAGCNPELSCSYLQTSCIDRLLAHYLFGAPAKVVPEDSISVWELRLLCCWSSETLIREILMRFCVGGICVMCMICTCSPGWDLYDLHDLHMFRRVGSV